MLCNFKSLHIILADIDDDDNYEYIPQTRGSQPDGAGSGSFVKDYAAEGGAAVLESELDGNIVHILFK